MSCANKTELCSYNNVYLYNYVPCPVSPAVPGQPGKFKVGRVTDTSIELTWEPAYTKEGIVNYELLYKPVKFGSLVRTSDCLFRNTSAG